MMDDPLVSIIIPYFNRWELTHQCLMDLYKNVPNNCEVILIDDASDDLVCGNGLNWWMKNVFKFKIRYYKNKKNVGFGQSMNNGAKLAHGKYLIFLSNDVRIYGNFITDVVYLLNNDDKMLIGGRIVDFPGGWNEFEIEGTKYVIPYAEGWLLCCSKEAWKGLGGFDTSYGKFDYEDVDLSIKALSLDYNVVALNSNKVQHLGSQTISGLNIDRMSITRRNRENFLSKWKDKIPLILKGSYYDSITYK